MTATRMVVVAGVLLGSLAHDATAHVGPSVRENNRYLKLTAFGNRVRLLYTYYVGEVPGAQARHRMDANGDGQLDATETTGYGDETAALVAGNLDIAIDGEAVPAAWQTIDTGIGSPTVNAGAFSVDMVMWLCLDDTAATHSIVLFDHWTPPTPGETELRIEESPGVAVRTATLGADGAVSQLRARWLGSTPLDKLGLHVKLEVDRAVADTTPANGCGAVATPADTGSDDDGGRPWIAFAAAAAVLAVAGAVVVARRK